MGIPVKLEVFEGPLDLLLHLIDKSKIDIYDIPIVTITNQYLEYIKAMESKDLNVMSEFLLMAATLLDIKCRMLLPKEVNEEGEEQDPREELVRQLLEYKMYKHMAYELRDREGVGSKILYKEVTLPEEVLEYKAPIDLDSILDGVTVDRLNSVFQEVVRRIHDTVDPIRSTFGTIEKEEVTLDDKMGFVHTFASENKKFSFRKLLETQKSKMHLVVTFLAILEMMKTGEIEVLQENTFDDILITSNI